MDIPFTLLSCPVVAVVLAGKWWLERRYGPPATPASGLFWNFQALLPHDGWMPASFVMGHGQERLFNLKVNLLSRTEREVVLGQGSDYALSLPGENGSGMHVATCVSKPISMGRGSGMTHRVLCLPSPCRRFDLYPKLKEFHLGGGPPAPRTLAEQLAQLFHFEGLEPDELVRLYPGLAHWLNANRSWSAQGQAEGLLLFNHREPAWLPDVLASLPPDLPRPAAGEAPRR